MEIRDKEELRKDREELRTTLEETFRLLGWSVDDEFVDNTMRNLRGAEGLLEDKTLMYDGNIYSIVVMDGNDFDIEELNSSKCDYVLFNKYSVNSLAMIKKLDNGHFECQLVGHPNKRFSYKSINRLLREIPREIKMLMESAS